MCYKAVVPQPQVSSNTPTVLEEPQVVSAVSTMMAASSTRVSDVSASASEVTAATLPVTGEANMNLIFGATALSILASLGLVATRKQED